jgi:hypothetical protein
MAHPVWLLLLLLLLMYMGFGLGVGTFVDAALLLVLCHPRLFLLSRSPFTLASHRLTRSRHRTTSTTKTSQPH